jgi:hypothetical protein
MFTLFAKTRIGDVATLVMITFLLIASSLNSHWSQRMARLVLQSWNLTDPKEVRYYFALLVNGEQAAYTGILGEAIMLYQHTKSCNAATCRCRRFV